jgi:hypothetical protein
MKVTIDGNTCIVQREPGDKGFYGQINSAWGGGESNLLHHVKLKLIQAGHDLIKKRMWKDGHMVDSDQQYLRARNTKKVKPGDLLYIYDRKWPIRNSAQEYNEGSEVHLAVVTL